MSEWVPLKITIFDYDANYRNDPNVRLIPNSLEKDIWIKVLVKKEYADKIEVKKVSLGGYF